MEFKQGDRVQWTSQAGGVSKQKIGTVVGHVPPKMSIVDVWNEAFPDEAFVRGCCGSFRSLLPRYLVLVDRPKKPVLYSPLASSLALLTTEEPSDEI